jgi:hypothetical protein
LVAVRAELDQAHARLEEATVALGTAEEELALTQYSLTEAGLAALDGAS